MRIALSLIVAAVLVPAATAAPTTTFVSKQYHYTIAVPGSAKYWTTNYAFIDWTKGPVDRAVPQFDTFTDTRVNRFFIIGARKEPAGTTLADWTAFFTTPAELGCKTTTRLGSSRLGGTAAQAFAFTCGDGVHGTGLTALHDGSGYFLLLSTFSGTTSEASDRAVFDAGRASFRFGDGR
jgi:hypothetical protein